MDTRRAFRYLQFMATDQTTAAASKYLRHASKLHIGLTESGYTVRAGFVGETLSTGKGYSSRRGAQIAGQEDAAALGCPDAARRVQMRADGWAGA